ncbi:MAG: hypothetical protein ABFD97_20600 [Syntrophobacter sp.]
MKEYLLRMYDFLAAHDFPTLMESMRQLDWRVVLKSGYTWLIALPIVVFVLWTKRFKILIALASMAGFLLLLQYTLPPTGEKIPLHDLLTFLGGSVALIGLNLYLLFIKES